MKWRLYGVSAINAFLSASAASLGSFGGATVAGVSTGKALQIAGITATIAGGVSFFKWIAQHPLPGADN